MSIRNTDKFEHPSRSSTATHIQNYTIFTRRSKEGVSVVLTSLSAYKGVMHGYLPQGNGILMLADGREFKGHFRDGEIIGKTTLRWEKIGLHHATYLQIDNQGKYNDYFKITDEDNEITRIFYDQEGLIDLDGKYRKLTPEHNFKFLNTTTGTWYINNIETREFKMIFPNKLKLTVSLDTGSGYLSDASGMIEVPITKKGVSASYRCGFDIKYFDKVDLHKDQNGVFYWIDQEKSAARNQIIIKKVQLRTGAVIEGEFIADIRESRFNNVDINLELELIEGSGVIRYDDLLFNFTLQTENENKYIIGEGAAPWSVLEVIIFRPGFDFYFLRDFTHEVIISGRLTKFSFIGEIILELSGSRVVLNIQNEDQTTFVSLLDERLPLKIISREGGMIFDGEGYLSSDIYSSECTGKGIFMSPFKANRFYIQTKDDNVTYSAQKVLDSGCMFLIDALSATTNYFEIKGDNSELLKGSLKIEEDSVKNAIIQGNLCSGSTTLKIEHHSGFIYSFSNETDMYRTTASKVDLWRTFQTIESREEFFNFIQSPGNFLGGDKVYATGQLEHYIYALHPITEIGQNLDYGVRRHPRKIATRRRNFFVDENYGLTLEGHYKLLDYIPQEYLLKTDSYDGTIIFGDSRIRCVKTAFYKDVLEIMYRKKLGPSSMIYNEITGVMTSAMVQVLGTETSIDRNNLPSYSTSIMYCGLTNVLGFSISKKKAFKKWEISPSNKIISLKC